MAYRDWPIVGHHEAIDFFEHLLAYEGRQPGNIGGAYILNGPAGIGKTAVLEAFLSRLLHTGQGEGSSSATFFTDVIRLDRLPEKREIGVEQIREFSAGLALSAYAGSYRIGVIASAETLSLEAANAILKTLEDAREQIMIFLLTSASNHLPATVLSRSQIIPFKNAPADDIYEWLIEKQGLARPTAKNIARLAGGLPGVALRLAQDNKFLEETLAPARSLYAALCAPLHERWQIINTLVGKGKIAVDSAATILAGWRLAARDLLLIRLNQPELARHAFLDQEARLAAQRLTISDVRSLENACARAMIYLKANVNPKLVLEQTVMNIL